MSTTGQPAGGGGPKRRVVVLGGGVAGLAVADGLGKAVASIPGASVTLVTERAFAYFKYAAPRAAVRGDTWVDRTLVPLKEGVGPLANAKLVVGRVAKVDDYFRTVTLADGTAIEWDVLVCATGSRAKGVAEPGKDKDVTPEDIRAHFAATKEAIAGAKKIVVVGGGPIGIETAGEIRAVAPPDTKITLVTGATGLLGIPKPPFPRSFTQSVEQMLRENQVALVRDEVKTPAFEGVAAVRMGPGKLITLASGKPLEADLILFCTGVEVNSGFYPPEWVDYVTKELKVEPTLLVKGRSDVFAVGDVAQTGKTKLGYEAIKDARVVVKNVLSVLKGAAPNVKHGVPTRSYMVLSFGHARGRSLLATPFSFLFGPTLLGDATTAKIKSKDMFAVKYWPLLGGVPAPPV